MFPRRENDAQGPAPGWVLGNPTMERVPWMCRAGPRRQSQKPTVLTPERTWAAGNLLAARPGGFSPESLHRAEEDGPWSSEAQPWAEIGALSTASGGWPSHAHPQPSEGRGQPESLPSRGHRLWAKFGHPKICLVS